MTATRRECGCNTRQLVGERDRKDIAVQPFLGRFDPWPQPMPLLRHETQPSGEVTAFGERISIADRGHHSAGDNRPNAGNAHQPDAPGVLLRDGFDIVR